MEFEQWKKSLDSDAREKNRELEKELQKLKAENNKLLEEKARLDKAYKKLCEDFNVILEELTSYNKDANDNDLIKDLESLANRCYVQTRGILCCFCELKAFKCKFKRTNTISKEEVMSEFIREANELEKSKKE